MNNKETDLARVQRAIAEVQRLREENRVASAARLAQIKKAGEAELEAAQARLEETRKQLQGLQEDWLGRMPAEAADYVLDPSFTNGRPNFSEAKRIEQWDDGEGNMIYTIRQNRTDGPTVREIRNLSSKVRRQQDAFGQLDPEVQSRRLLSSSQGTESGVEPYRDYLRSEVLRERFDYLKQNPPRPS